MKKILGILLALVLLIPMPGLAGGWREDPEGLKVYFRDPEEWTFVTKDNLDDNLAVCLRRGDTEAEVRARFGEGTIRWEAYHEKLPDGCVRYEVWENELTRNVWNLNTLGAKERAAFMDALAGAWGAGRYRFINARFQSSGTDKHMVKLGVLSNPPLRYESGLGGLRVANGQAFLTGYFQVNGRASKSSFLGRVEDTLSRLTRYLDWDWSTFQMEFTQECADLSVGADMIVNAHTGTVRLRGAAEPGAQVRARSGDHDIAADVAEDGAFTADIPLEAEGSMAVDFTASLPGKADNALYETVPVDNGKARLTLTEYPSGEVTGDISLKGEAAPGASVSVSLDGAAPEAVPVQDGAFSYAVTAGSFVPHTLVVTASEEGLADCSVTLDFTHGYDDFDAGVKAFARSLAKVNARQLADDPGAYAGSFIKMEFRTTGVRYGKEGLILEATARAGGKKYPVLLKADGYMDDMVVGGMNVTIHGIVEAPLPEDDGLPCVRVVFLSFLRVIYR